ncbi:Eco57I restriction-modification methylase domain-containing protein [Ramlibacter agri]|uniref:Eco57I restriction-modification methylase domain-containing protein n=1 Tax=Ramlibacter agri TaxID=2728837 RepID=UPI00197FA52B|nr:hypothetical protein [Ramlibacter agri]
MLDPSCGDGQFIAGHPNAVGIEQDPYAARQAMDRAPGALVHEGDFFSWASNTSERFECAAGNPPFIRYQTFKGELRDRALAFCSRLGVRFSGLASSWAPFLVATAALLRRGGRMAFVVPAEIGHAPYSAPLLEYLLANFAVVHIVAIREKLFPELSEDCWLMYAEGHGASTNEIRFTALDAFSEMSAPPRQFQNIPADVWRTTWKRRLRPFLMTSEARLLYQEIVEHRGTHRFGELATIGIGYVTGANDFFHLRPSDAHQWRIPKDFLRPTVRKGASLRGDRLTTAVVDKWRKDDEQVLLLHIPKHERVPRAVERYLDTEAGQLAREAYKCRVREPWYSVPDVQVPDFFLSYMSGVQANLVVNEASCTCSNSVHGVHLKRKGGGATLLESWSTEFVKLSSEIEGHPLGGGMLKLEPREAKEIAIPSKSILQRISKPVVEDALSTLRKWRHYDSA